MVLFLGEGCDSCKSWWGTSSTCPAARLIPVARARQLYIGTGRGPPSILSGNQTSVARNGAFGVGGRQFKSYSGQFFTCMGRSMNWKFIFMIMLLLLLLLFTSPLSQGYELELPDVNRCDRCDQMLLGVTSCDQVGHILCIYRLYWDTLVPDDDFGKMTIY